MGKEVNITRHVTRDVAIDAGFNAFWDVYPKKVAKQDAVKAWKKLAPDEGLQASIFLAVKQQAQKPDWLRDEGKFIPYPASWLNGRR